MRKSFKNIFTNAVMGLGILSIVLCGGCGKNEVAKAEPYDGSSFVREAEYTQAGENAKAFAQNYEVIQNFDQKLSVPTYITKLGDDWFIVDCYHNRIIYSDTLGIPLDQWKIMTSEVTQPHTIAGDGKVLVVDDTENNRILGFEKIDGKYINTQVIGDVGTRPHYTVYDEITDTFYVWSSKTGELFCLRHTPDSAKLYVTDILKIKELDGIYVRSFSIIEGEIYFVSGVSDEGAPAKIYCCDLNTLSIKKEISVPDSMAGMVQITKIQDYYYITISTDLSGSQDYATIIRTKALDKLSSGEYEDIYSTYFVGGGTPYYISYADGTYFLTEHRLKDHSIWSFKVEKNQIKDVTTLY
ncbi:hypothetical protein [Butyrivibrio sp. YAB3001]|uniref:hypothetical protein n=1 Tax=Butyrivibrio sp. YAB3001 TaxID=1520812 RepID=UPI0008F66B0F|nr:hypothetical protein [Butyrivibrio sp. YAB3001]SFB76687.1 hypothetical protein SAMN02910398_00700 [Butyrivibrio sp. YAB3001]